MCIRDRYSKADIPEHTQYDTQSLAKFALDVYKRQPLNQAIGQHLMQGDLQENLDRL